MFWHVCKAGWPRSGRNGADFLPAHLQLGFDFHHRPITPPLVFPASLIRLPVGVDWANFRPRMEENAPPLFNAPPPAPPPAAPPPPPLAPPPVIMPPSPPRPPRRGRGWMIFAFVLLALLVLSVLFNIGSFSRTVMRGTGAASFAHAAGTRL